jgi:hypothetical protein
LIIDLNTKDTQTSSKNISNFSNFNNNKKKYQSHADLKRNSISNLNNFFFNGNMYIINENSGQENQQHFNTSINKNLHTENYMSGTMLNLDSKSINVHPKFNKNKIDSSKNFLGKRTDHHLENSPNQFRISSHQLGTSLLHSNFNNDMNRNNSPNQFDNFSLANKSEQKNLSSVNLNRDPLYESWKYLPQQKSLKNPNKTKNHLPMKSYFFPQNPQIKIPLTPDYRNLKKKPSYNKIMNSNLQNFNLSNHAPNLSNKCSPFLEHSPLSEFDRIKQFPNYKNIPFSNNSIMDIRSHRGSDNIQYSFKETKIVNNKYSPTLTRKPLFKKITELCNKNMSKNHEKMTFLNNNNNSYFDDIFEKEPNNQRKVDKDIPK